VPFVDGVINAREPTVTEGSSPAPAALPSGFTAPFDSASSSSSPSSQSGDKSQTTYQHCRELDDSLAQRDHSLYPRKFFGRILRGWHTATEQDLQKEVAVGTAKLGGSSSGGGSTYPSQGPSRRDLDENALISREVGMEKLRSRTIRGDRLSARDVGLVQLVARALGDELAMREVGEESRLNTRNIDELD
jgi:hypothetical protein